MIYGQYDAKEGQKGEEVGFVPGGSSIHNCMYDTNVMPDEYLCFYSYHPFLFFFFLAVYLSDPFNCIIHLYYTPFMTFSSLSNALTFFAFAS